MNMWFNKHLFFNNIFFRKCENCNIGNLPESLGGLEGLEKM